MQSTYAVALPTLGGVITTDGMIRIDNQDQLRCITGGIKSESWNVFKSSKPVFLGIESYEKNENAKIHWFDTIREAMLFARKQYPNLVQKIYKGDNEDFPNDITDISYRSENPAIYMNILKRENEKYFIDSDDVK